MRPGTAHGPSRTGPVAIVPARVQPDPHGMRGTLTVRLRFSFLDRNGAVHATCPPPPPERACPWAPAPVMLHLRLAAAGAMG